MDCSCNARGSEYEVGPNEALHVIVGVVVVILSEGRIDEAYLTSRKSISYHIISLCYTVS